MAKHKVTDNHTRMPIPAPRKNEENWEYMPIIRVGRIVPFGYKQCPKDPQMILPIKEELELLEQAKKHLDHYSLRDVSQWLTEQSGRYISHQGLRDRVASEKTRGRRLANLRFLIKEYEKAIKKAKRLEDSTLGRQQKVQDREEEASGS